MNISKTNPPIAVTENKQNKTHFKFGRFILNSATLLALNWLVSQVARSAWAQSLSTQGNSLEEDAHRYEVLFSPLAQKSISIQGRELSPLFVHTDPSHALILSENFFSAQECDQLLSFLEEHKDQVYSSITLNEKKQHQGLSKTRISSELTLLPPPRSIDWPSKEIAFIVKKICSFLATQFASTPTDILSRIETLSIISYEKEVGIFHYHADDMEPENRYRRIATMIVYLNDVAEGGKTVFPLEGISITPQKGRAILFRNQGQKGPYHGGEMPISGAKHILSLFLMEKIKSPGEAPLSSKNRWDARKSPYALPDLP